jgi:hypothetical protein
MIKKLYSPKDETLLAIWSVRLAKFVPLTLKYRREKKVN